MSIKILSFLGYSKQQQQDLERLEGFYKTIKSSIKSGESTLGLVFWAPKPPHSSWRLIIEGKVTC